MRDRDRTIAGTPKRTRRDECDGCGARLMFVRWLNEDRTLAGWVACDPTADLTSGVRASMAWRFDRRLDHRIGFRTSPQRLRPAGWKATTIHAATCSAARRHDRPANERPVGENDLAEDPTLFDPITNA